jgi:hypothetical protein
MDVDSVVMAAYRLYGVRAESTEAFAGPVEGVTITVMTFPDADEAETFTDACMAERRIPARQYGARVVLLH